MPNDYYNYSYTINHINFSNSPHEHVSVSSHRPVPVLQNQIYLENGRGGINNVTEAMKYVTRP